MPHVGSSNAEDLASSDEIKVFEDEGEDEKRASADLTDLKSSLITEGDQEKSSQAFSSKSTSQQSTSHHQNGQRSESTSNFGKALEPPLGYPAFGYSLPHSPYHPNGTLGQMANKMAAAAAASSGSPLPFMMPNMEGFPQPPPAHMGISPVMRCETKANISMWMDIEMTNISRNPLYNLSGHGQYLSDFTQQLQWPPAMYQLQQAAFRGPYPLPPVSSSAFPSFGRTPLMPHPSLSGHSFHPSFLPSAANNGSANISLPNGLSNGSKLVSRNGSTSNSSSNNLLVNGECRIKQEHSPQPAISNSRQMSANSPSANNHDSSNNNNPSISNKNRGNNDFSDSKLHKHSPNSRSQSSNGSDRESHNSKNSAHHVKKPLNAFMIYMKEMRAKVIAESTLKESAAINQILGKRWHSLSRVEQEKYYEKAKKERELHMTMHPGWTAKDNYAINAKRKKKKRERNADGERGALKKCRARYGLDQQNSWCKPCRRKKKCIRYMEAARAAQLENRNDNDDNLGSVGSVEAPTPESKSTNESDHENPNSTDLSLSSPSSDYHHFMSTFTGFPSAPSLTPQSNAHLHLNGHSNGHLPSPSLFYPHHNSPSSSLNSPIGSRMSSLLTPNSPLTSLSNFSSCSPLGPPIPAPATPTPAQMPPRNSPFSIEQLARPHCPQNRSSPHSSSKLLNSTGHSKSNGSVTVSVITQLPTPPSSTDSTSATPTMLSVA